MESASNHRAHQAGASTSTAETVHNSSLANTPSTKSRGDRDDLSFFDGSRSQIGISIFFKGFLSGFVALRSAANPPHATRNKNNNDPARNTLTHTLVVCCTSPFIHLLYLSCNPTSVLSFLLTTPLSSSFVLIRSKSCQCSLDGPSMLPPSTQHHHHLHHCL